MNRVIIFLCAFFLGQVLVFAQDKQPSPKSTSFDLDIHAVQIVLNDEHRQGVDWEAIVSDFHQLSLKKDNNPIWTDKKYRLSVGVVSSDDFAVLLEALDTVGQMTQYPQPLMPIDGNVPVAADLLFPISGADPSSGTQKIHIEISQIPNAADGVVLSIVPVIDTMIVDTRDNQRVITPARLTAQTEVSTQPGQTIVLGSLIREDEIKKTNKFPLLGDLPIVGLVFRYQGKLMQKTETIIFLTPHINKTPTTSEAAKQ